MEHHHTNDKWGGGDPRTNKQENNWWNHKFEKIQTYFHSGPIVFCLVWHSVEYLLVWVSILNEKLTPPTYNVLLTVWSRQCIASRVHSRLDYLVLSFTEKMALAMPKRQHSTWYSCSNLWHTAETGKMPSLAHLTQLILAWSALVNSCNPLAKRLTLLGLGLS